MFLDLGSRRNNDTAQLKSVLEAKLRQGRLSGEGLEVREPGDNWFRVISGPGQSVSQSYHIKFDSSKKGRGVTSVSSFREGFNKLSTVN